MSQMLSEKGKVSQVIDKHQDKQFVQRIVSPKDYPKLDLGKGNYATHKMSYSTFNDGAIAYPSIVYDQNTGKLNPLKSNEALMHAIRSGEFIKFDTPEEADWFSQNYKKYWEE